MGAGTFLEPLLSLGPLSMFSSQDPSTSARPVANSSKNYGEEGVEYGDAMSSFPVSSVKCVVPCMLYLCPHPQQQVLCCDSDKTRPSSPHPGVSWVDLSTYPGTGTCSGPDKVLVNGPSGKVPAVETGHHKVTPAITPALNVLCCPCCEFLK